MTDTLNILVGFILGLLTATALFVGFGIYQLRKIKKLKENFEQELDKEIVNLNGKRDSIRERLLKASEIMKRQVELRGHAEMPSANSAHSKYKNGLISEMTELENEKIAILQSILDDGFDPTITLVGPGGTKEEMPLSTFLNNGVKKEAEVKQPEENQTPSVRKVGKFVVHKGGKDDSGTTQ